MLRRLIRARRHIPVGSAGHDTADRTPTHTHRDDPESLDVHYTSLKDDNDDRTQPPDGLAAMKIGELGLELLRAKAKSHIETVTQQEQDAAAAWVRLQQLYNLFQAVEEVTVDEEMEVLEKNTWENSKVPHRRKTRDQGLRTLFDSPTCAPGVIWRDFQSLTDQLPQGFTAEMFISLGDALYQEIQVAQAQGHVSREALETLGDSLYAQAVVVSA